MFKLVVLAIFALALLIGCSPVESQGWKPEEATMASMFTDSISVGVDKGFYVSENHGGTHVVSKEPVEDSRPVVGDYTKGLNTYHVRCGVRNLNCDSKGSLYIYRVSGESGLAYKSYLSIAQRAQVDFF